MVFLSVFCFFVFCFKFVLFLFLFVLFLFILFESVVVLFCLEFDLLPPVPGFPPLPYLFQSLPCPLSPPPLSNLVCSAPSRSALLLLGGPLAPIGLPRSVLLRLPFVVCLHPLCCASPWLLCGLCCVSQSCSYL